MLDAYYDRKQQEESFFDDDDKEWIWYETRSICQHSRQAWAHWGWVQREDA
jgi:hypothetical protein